VPERNSTIVRTKNRWVLRGVRGGFRFLNHIPRVAIPLADALFCTPPRMRLSPRGETLLASGRRLQVERGGRQIAAWMWGTGPTVYLVHGWGGRAAQLRSFIQPLLERGFSVVAVDLPAHGRSDGRRTSLIEAAAALREVVDRTSPAHAIIAHSFGAATVSLALEDGLDAGRVVFIGPAAEPVGWTHHFGETLGILPEVMEGMRRRTERRLGFRWVDLGVTRQARSRAQPLLVVHDVEDDEVAHADGVAIADAWPGARLLSTRLRGPEATGPGSRLARRALPPSRLRAPRWRSRQSHL
jgi:pimeloyl-ACP methyl ester carboxylesterase